MVIPTSMCTSDFEISCKSQIHDTSMCSTTILTFRRCDMNEEQSTTARSTVNSSATLTPPPTPTMNVGETYWAPRPPRRNSSLAYRPATRGITSYNTTGFDTLPRYTSEPLSPTPVFTTASQFLRNWRSGSPATLTDHDQNVPRASISSDQVESERHAGLDLLATTAIGTACTTSMTYLDQE